MPTFEVLSLINLYLIFRLQSHSAHKISVLSFFYAADKSNAHITIMVTQHLDEYNNCLWASNTTRLIDLPLLYVAIIYSSKFLYLHTAAQ